MKRSRFYRSLFLFVPILSVLAFPAGAVFSETLAVPGTGACEPIVDELANAFNRINPAVQVSVPPSTGSGGGISAVLKGEAHLARIARPLKEAEERQGLVQLVFARDAVAFVVDKDLKVSNLSTAQVVDIFTGKISNWKDVGAQPAMIRVVTREPGDSSLAVLQEHIKEFRDMAFTPKAKVVLYDRATVETLEKYKNTVGFITMSSYRWAKGRIKPVSLDGIAPTPENMLSGKYRLVESYALIYKKELTPAAKKFVDFVFSAEGKKILTGNRLIAVNRDGK